MDPGKEIILEDPAVRVQLDTDSVVKIAGTVLLVPANRMLGVTADGQKMSITPVSTAKATLTKFNILTGTDVDEEPDGPYDLKAYDETHAARGRDFYYDGDHFRGEKDSIVLNHAFLATLFQGWFDENGEANSKLWDYPPKININHLVPRIKQLSDEVALHTGKDKKALRELITYIRKRKEGTFRMIEECKRNARVAFDDVEQVFGFATRVIFQLDGQKQGGSVEKVEMIKTLQGRWWEVTVRYIGTDGEKFTTEKQVLVIPFFGGTQPFNMLPLTILFDDSEEHKALEERGKRFVEFARGHHYLSYTGSAIDERGRWKKKVRGTGRVMIDTSSYKVMNPNVRTNYSDSYNKAVTVDQVHPKDHVLCHAFLRGFSFSAKSWLVFNIDDLAAIRFDDQAFDNLVLDADVKRTIETLVTTFNSFAGMDVITNKSDGLVITLAGPPGVGKTLTCEAVAERLHLPLYSVTVGELGQTIEQLEARLKSLLEISARWNAVTLIDEADIFMHARDDRDVVRNGFVGIFLRLLEYQQGILFLTTNRYASVDPAFRSRISLALTYHNLEESARRTIWKTYLDRSKMQHKVDLDSLSKYDLNGREIRSLIRIAAALAKNSDDPVIRTEHLRKVVDIQETRFAAHQLKHVAFDVSA